MGCDTKHDFCIKSGDTFRQPITYKAAGVATDITGFTFALSLKSKVPNTTPAASAVCTITDAVNGTFECVIDSVTTASLLTAGKNKQVYVYDLEMTAPNGDVKTILGGNFIFDKGLTNNV